MDEQTLLMQLQRQVNNLTKRVDRLTDALRRDREADRQRQEYFPRLLTHQIEISERSLILRLDRFERRVRMVEEGDKSNPKRSISINEVKLSNRAFNALRRCEIMTLGEVSAMTESELTHLPNVGRATVSEIKTMLADFGMTLAME